MLYLFAQVVNTAADPITAWGSLILQGGAFGLLVYIIAVMYPRATKESRDERTVTQDRFEALVDRLHLQFEDRNKQLATAIREQTIQLTESLKGNADRVERAVVAVCRANQAASLAHHQADPRGPKPS